MRKFGLRRALSTKPVPRQDDPVFIQEDVDEHGQVITTRHKPARNNSLLGRVFRKKSKHPEDLHTIHSHSGSGLVVQPDPMRPAPSVAYSDHDQHHSFGGAGTHLMSEPTHYDHSVRGHSVRDHSVHGHSTHGGTVIRDDRSRGYPDYASTAGHTRDVYERDFGREDVYPHEHVTVINDSPRQSHISGHDHHHHHHHQPAYSTTGGTVIQEIHDSRSTSGRSGRSLRSAATNKQEVSVNLMPGEKQEFVIGPNTQLIVPDDVELEISDGKGGWLPYHESLLRRPPREEVYVISGGSNFIVEDELGNVLHRSQPAHYSTGPISVAGSVAGRSTRSRRDEGTVYVDG